MENMVKMTQEEWKQKHSDFKCIMEGQKYILGTLDARGTTLIPVQIIKKTGVKQ